MQTIKKPVEYKVRVSMLCELYGKLLTDNQKSCIEDYYNNDLSLSEIAENHNITRQAVRDVIQKGEKKLFEYEKKLKFMDKTLKQQKKIDKILMGLTKIKQKEKDKELIKIVEKITNCINNL